MKPAEIQSKTALVDYAASLDCIHCGLCLESCPTYRLTGAESASPRGRIHLMRAVAEDSLPADSGFRTEIESCLVCRNCESVCPAGVRMGEMVSFTRDAMTRHEPWSIPERAARWFGFRRVLPSRTALRISSSLLRLGQRSGLLATLARLSPFFGSQLKSLASLPAVPPASERRLLPPRLRPEGANAKDGTEAVVLLEGCIMPELYSEVNRATARVLTHLGTEVHTTRDAVCCGALHAHNGDLEGARALARKLIAAYEKSGGPAEPSTAPIVINSAGCGAHLKELAHLFSDGDPWRPRAQQLAKRVVDFSEYVRPRLSGKTLKVQVDLPGPVVWDSPCHLCHGQGIREEPLSLLGKIEFRGGALVEMDLAESCCGSAGIYSALHPADATAILSEKLDALERSGARLLVTANPGCQMQWQSGIRDRGLNVQVKHLAEVLELALRR